MTLHRPIVPQALLWPFKWWLRNRDVDDFEAHVKALPRTFFEPEESRRDKSTRSLWQAFQFENEVPALGVFRRDLTAWKSRLLEVTLALCDVVSPLPEQRVLRLIARTGCIPSYALKMTSEGLTAAIGYGEIHVTRHGRRNRWVVIDPVLKAEMEALVHLAKGRDRLAGMLTKSRRADSNSAAQTKLRRSWESWCEEHGIEATLTDLSEGITQRAESC